MPRQIRGPAFGNKSVVSPAAHGANKAGRMLALLGAPLLVVPRSYTALDEQVPALAVQDDTSFLTDQWILRNFSQAARECSARDEECLTAVREAVYRLLYGSNETDELPLPVLTSTERREEQASAAAAAKEAADAAKAEADAAAEEPLHLVSDDHPWRALQTNWWMPFVDGWAHKCGVTVFDHHSAITFRGGDGLLSAHLKAQYDRFSRYDMMNRAHLSIDMVEGMNMNLQGVSWAANPDHGNWEKASPYTEWSPRHDDKGAMMGYKGAVHVDKAKIFRDAEATRDWSDNRDVFRKVRLKLTGKPLWDFYDAVAKPDCKMTNFTDSHADHSHPRAALGCLLPAAATLYATMAELHPFIDGNSRTRTMVLNTQLTRMGAHPVVLYNNGWAPYHMNSLEELEEYLLGGYCAWEYVLATGKSPYVGHEPDYNCAHPPRDDKKDERASGANRSPVPLYDPGKDVCLVPQGLRQ